MNGGVMWRRIESNLVDIWGNGGVEGWTNGCRGYIHTHVCLINHQINLYLNNMKTKAKRTRKSKGTRKKHGGLFEWFNQKNNTQNIT